MGSKKEVYVNEIRPLLKQLLEIVERENMPFLVTVAGDDGMWTNYSGLEAGTSRAHQRLRAAVRVLKPSVIGTEIDNMAEADCIAEAENALAFLETVIFPTTTP